MKKYISVIKNSPLFKNISENEIPRALIYLNAHVKEYKKGQYIYSFGDNVKFASMVINGLVHIQKEDYWGNTDIRAGINSGELFGEIYACFPNIESGISAIAAADSIIMHLDINKLTVPPPSEAPFYNALFRNFISAVAAKNLILTEKLEHVTQRTTKNKLLSYLSSCYRKAGGAVFEIPFNRQQLADYLAVDRSAMSAELSKLKRQNIIDFKKNKFTLLNK